MIFNPTMVANIGYAYSNGSIYTRPHRRACSTSSPDVKIPDALRQYVDLIPTHRLQRLRLTTLGGGAVYGDHGINHQAFGDFT